MSGRGTDARGQVAPLVALLVLGTGLAVLALGRVGAAAVTRAAATTAADAAALAGAAAGPQAAEALAAANGARVIRYRATGDGARVVVDRRGGRAEARAARAGRPGRGPGGLAPALRAALARAAQLLGEPVPVTSGYRSPAEQARLYARRATNPYPVAPPGASMHERGLAVDVPRSVAERLAAVASRVGLCRPYPRTDPVHFELC